MTGRKKNLTDLKTDGLTQRSTERNTDKLTETLTDMNKALIDMTERPTD